MFETAINVMGTIVLVAYGLVVLVAIGRVMAMANDTRAMVVLLRRVLDHADYEWTRRKEDDDGARDQDGQQG